MGDVRSISLWEGAFLSGGGYSAYPLLFAIIGSVFFLPLPFLVAFVFKKRNDIA